MTKIVIHINQEDNMPLFCDTADTAGMIFLCTEQAEQYVIQSKVYKGWLGQGPGLEALSLMGGGQLTLWCEMRQAMGSGFTGPPNKPEDTCCSSWVRATLSLHSRKHVVTRSSNTCHSL